MPRSFRGGQKGGDGLERVVGTGGGGGDEAWGWFGGGVEWISCLSPAGAGRAGGGLEGVWDVREGFAVGAGLGGWVG